MKVRDGSAGLVFHRTRTWVGYGRLTCNSNSLDRDGSGHQIAVGDYPNRPLPPVNSCAPGFDSSVAALSESHNLGTGSVDGTVPHLSPVQLSHSDAQTCLAVFADFGTELRSGESFDRLLD
jgi:hypothetical protein